MYPENFLDRPPGMRYAHVLSSPLGANSKLKSILRNRIKTGQFEVTALTAAVQVGHNF